MQTEHQQKILNLYKEGKSIKEIAEILQISHHCVKSVLILVLNKELLKY